MPIPEGDIPLRWSHIAELCYVGGWRDLNLIKAVATCLSESGGYQFAYHDNVDAHGTILSRDVGLFQINIPAKQIDTAAEHDLYGVANNLARARSLFVARGFQPWYGYTLGHATSNA